jgi:hypothetical protein
MNVTPLLLRCVTCKHYRVIKVLCELGKDDRPVGTMSLVLEIVAEMLTKIRLVPDATNLPRIQLYGTLCSSSYIKEYRTGYASLC